MSASRSATQPGVLSYVWDPPRLDGYQRILRGALGSWPASSNAASTLFGRILAAGNPRIVQLAGKIYF